MFVVSQENYRGSLQSLLKLFDECYDDHDLVVLHQHLGGVRPVPQWNLQIPDDGRTYSYVTSGSPTKLNFLGWTSDMKRIVHTRRQDQEVIMLGASADSLAGGKELAAILRYVLKTVPGGAIPQTDAVLSVAFWALGCSSYLPERGWAVSTGSAAHASRGRNKTGGRRALAFWMSHHSRAAEAAGVGHKWAELGMSMTHDDNEVIIKHGSTAEYRAKYHQ